MGFRASDSLDRGVGLRPGPVLEQCRPDGSKFALVHVGVRGGGGGRFGGGVGEEEG